MGQLRTLASQNVRERPEAPGWLRHPNRPQKVNAEMTDLRSKLAAIDNDLDECRRRHFEHPRARSQIRRGAPLSGIVCSVASRNLPSLASAPAGDHWGLVLCRRSAL